MKRRFAPIAIFLALGWAPSMAGAAVSPLTGAWFTQKDRTAYGMIFHDDGTCTMQLYHEGVDAGRDYHILIAFKGTYKATLDTIDMLYSGYAEVGKSLKDPSANYVHVTPPKDMPSPPSHVSYRLEQGTDGKAKLILLDSSGQPKMTLLPGNELKMEICSGADKSDTTCQEIPHLTNI